MPERLLTTGEIADYCQVSRVTVFQWIRKEQIPAFSTPGGHYRVKLSDFRRFLEQYDMPVDRAFFNQDKERILVVDDNSQVADFIASALEGDDEEYRRELEKAADGFEAGLKIASFKPHLVVLDLMMPGLNGFKVCEQVKSDPETRDIKVLVVTGYASDENISRALELGADDYLVKPLDTQELQDRVRELLGS
jgi:excisionase family DNA binding protein